MGLRLSKKTQEWICTQAPEHIPMMNSPDTFDGCRDFFNSNGYHAVFEGGSRDTLFDSEEYKWAYRAWHDSLHFKYGFGFSEQDEYEIARIQQQESLNAGMSRLDALLLRIDLEAHVKHFYTWGEHPVMQTDMIYQCLLYGDVEQVIQSQKFV